MTSSSCHIFLDGPNFFSPKKTLSIPSWREELPLTISFDFSCIRDITRYFISKKLLFFPPHLGFRDRLDLSDVNDVKCLPS